MHIVEELIAERAKRLMSHKRMFGFIRPFLYRFLAYEDTVRLVDTIKPRTGHEAFQMAADHISPRTKIKGLENVPNSGRCIIIANHPTGLADGMAVFQTLKGRRPDHLYLANADAIRVIPRGEDIIIPVEWVLEKRSIAKTRETLARTRKVLSDERCIVIFPAGRLARMTWRGLKDQSWESSAAMLAKKYNAPVVPLHIKARNSWIYYLFSRINGELRDITLFYELLNKKNQLFRMTFGEAIEPETLPKNADDATKQIRDILEAL